jgi:CRISPR/Cas system-associated exonuclease Cas4 (RecB family)
VGGGTSGTGETVKVRENPELATGILEAAWARSRAKERVAGLHVSDLVYCLRKGWYKRLLGEPPIGDIHEVSVLLLGEGHHAVLQPAEGSEHSIVLHTPRHRVHGTVDVWAPSGLLFKHPTEIKTTRTSSNKPLAIGMPQYIDQLASYCLTLEDSCGTLVVWHIFGDYNKVRTPVLRVWDIEFSPDEMERWQAELDRRADLVSGPTKPPIDDQNHYTWECDYCPFNFAKGGPCEGGKGRPVPFFRERGLPEFMEKG